MCPFFEQETDKIPQYFTRRVRRDPGQFWDWLPEGAISHDPDAYLESEELTATTEATPCARYARPPGVTGVLIRQSAGCRRYQSTLVSRRLKDGYLNCDQTVSAVVACYCMIFSDIAKGWGV